MADLAGLKKAVENIAEEVRHLENLVSQEERPSAALTHRLERTRQVLVEVRRMYYAYLETHPDESPGRDVPERGRVS